MNKAINTFLIIAAILAMVFLIIRDSHKRKKDFISKKNNFQEYAFPSFASDSNYFIFFYGNTCPHCQEVERWMEEKQIDKKAKIIKKEIYENKTNARELSLIAQKCGLDTNAIAVPFLFAENNCYLGTPDIINYLSEKLGL